MKVFLIVFCLSAFLMSGCVKPQGGSACGEDENATYAVVNGKEIKAKEVLEKIKNDLAESQRQVYELKRRETEEIAQKMILEDEAKKQGTTVEKLFSQFDPIREKEVSKGDMTEFLKARNFDEKRLTKEQRAQLPNIIKSQRVQEAAQKYVADLRSKANIQLKIPKPVEKTVEVGVGTGPALGGANAKVTVVEFSDFQCPFCARGRQRVDELKDKYKDKVKIYFRNFPLTNIHPQAFHAAEAAACALEQSKFWDYHNKLFDNQQKLDEKSLLAYAGDIGLDSKKFEECLKSGKKSTEIQKDIEDATKVGVNSTPTFFINGHILRGAQPLEAFAEIIDEELGSKQ